MDSPNTPYVRAEQILRVLAKHGPISVTGLETILEPPIHRKRLLAALSRLRRDGFLERRRENTYGSTYHYIADKPKLLKVLAWWLDLPEGELRLPCFRQVELIHSELCAVWYHRFQRMFPSARILREHEYASDPIASNVLLAGQIDVVTRPDLMILFPRANAPGWIAVAVEVERFLKSKRRLMQKLDRFATRSLLDGLIYVCGKDAIAGTLRHVYNSRVIKNALRVNHYGNNFMLFTGDSAGANPDAPLMHNAALQKVSVHKWMHHLSQIEMSRRRDSNIA